MINQLIYNVLFWVLVYLLCNTPALTLSIITPLSSVQICDLLLQIYFSASITLIKTLKCQWNNFSRKTFFALNPVMKVQQSLLFVGLYQCHKSMVLWVIQALQTSEMSHIFMNFIFRPHCNNRCCNNDPYCNNKFNIKSAYLF